MGLSMFTMMSLPLPLMLCSKFMSSGGQTTPMLILYTFCGMDRAIYIIFGSTSCALEIYWRKSVAFWLHEKSLNGLVILLRTDLSLHIIVFKFFSVSNYEKGIMRK